MTRQEKRKQRLLISHQMGQLEINQCIPCDVRTNSTKQNAKISCGSCPVYIKLRELGNSLLSQEVKVEIKVNLELDSISKLDYEKAKKEHGITGFIDKYMSVEQYLFYKEEKNVKDIEIAKQLGVNPSTLQRWKKDKELSGIGVSRAKL